MYVTSKCDEGICQAYVPTSLMPPIGKSELDAFFEVDRNLTGLGDTVLVHEMTLLSGDKRLWRDAVVFLVSFSGLLTLFLAKYYEVFAPPFVVIFILWLVCAAATVDFCRHAWARYLKPLFFN